MSVVFIDKTDLGRGSNAFRRTKARAMGMAPAYAVGSSRALTGDSEPEPINRAETKPRRLRSLRLAAIRRFPRLFV